MLLKIVFTYVDYISHRSRLFLNTNNFNLNNENVRMLHKICYFFYITQIDIENLQLFNHRCITHKQVE